MVAPRALAAHGRIGIDSAIFIYGLERHPQFAPLADAVFRAVGAGQLTAIASTIVLAELLVHPYRRGRDADAERYVRQLSAYPNLTLVAPDVTICQMAARLRGTTPSLRLADAVHLATAIEAGASAFVTNDLALRRIGPLEIVRLTELAPSGA